MQSDLVVKCINVHRKLSTQNIDAFEHRTSNQFCFQTVKEGFHKCIISTIAGTVKAVYKAIFFQHSLKERNLRGLPLSLGRQVKENSGWPKANHIGRKLGRLRPSSPL